VTRGASSRRQRRELLRLDPAVRLAVQRFVRVLARQGAAPRAIESEVERICRRLPRSWVDRPNVSERGLPSHVLTLWFSDPAFLDGLGNPRPLPLRASPLSIEALAQRVDPELDLRYVLRYLQRGRALRRIGTRYVPRNRVVIFREREGATHVLSGLFGLLKTLEHNALCGPRTPRKLQLFCRNPNLPVSAVTAFRKRFGGSANRLVVQSDADLYKLECTRRPGERTVRMGVGVYQFEEDPPPRRNSRKPQRRRTRKGSRA
jgi:hypothetical protein